MICLIRHSDGDDENDNFQGFHNEWIFNEFYSLPFFPHIISIIIYKYCIKVIIKYTVTKIIQTNKTVYLYAYNFINQYFIVIWSKTVNFDKISQNFSDIGGHIHKWVVEWKELNMCSD